MLKVGDRLYCYCTNRVDDSIDYVFTIGRYYNINAIHDTLSGSKISITTDNDENDWFYEFEFSRNEYPDAQKHRLQTWYYRNWFYTENEMRKIKLNKLKDVDTI